MMMQVDQETAKKVLVHQLKDLSGRVDACAKLFEKGQYKEAYKMFPYFGNDCDGVGQNLEQFMGTLDKN